MIRQLDNDIIQVDKAETLRYLGYKNSKVDEETARLLDECIHEIKNVSELMYVYQLFDIHKENNTVFFKNSSIEIESNDLAKLFKTSDKAAVIAATLGYKVEQKIKYYSLTDLTKGVIFDACAASYIEALCDYAEAEIKEIANSCGLSTTFRYSPGYGDVHISHQASILSSLNAQKHIGLTVSDSSILIPRKSVTAFIGFAKVIEQKQKTCIDCNLFGNCSFSKGGTSCVK